MKAIFFLGMFFLSCIQLLNAQDSTITVPLWQKGAPGFENKKNEPEQAKDWWVKNIHNPSLTIFFPAKEKATGAAVVICPGGGHRLLTYNSEGKEAARYLTSIGVTAFVLKYRLFREENSPYTEAHARQDAVRAMRLARSMATGLQIDTARIGMMGFSAGGEMVSWTAYQENKGNPVDSDPVETYSAKPSFQVLIYPGPLGIPDTVPVTAPPAFLLAANDDVCCAGPIVQLLNKYRVAKVPVEVHLYAQGDHAFNMGLRTKLTSIKNWPQRLADWLADNGWLKKK